MRTKLSSLTKVIVIALLATGCNRTSQNSTLGHVVTNASSPKYGELVAAFTVGVASLQAGDDAAADVKSTAETKLKRVTELAPQEPAAWANLGLLATRQQQWENAAKYLQKSLSLASNSAQIYSLMGLLEKRQGKEPEAVKDMRKAVELAPTDIKAKYALAEELESLGEGADLSESQKLLKEILAVHPENLEAQLELARFSSKLSDSAVLKSAIIQIGRQLIAPSQIVKQQYDAVVKASTGANLKLVATQIQFLKNTLKPVPAYQASIAFFGAVGGQGGDPIDKFLVLPNPSPTPAAPDTSLTFAPEPVTIGANGSWAVTGLITLNSPPDSAAPPPTPSLFAADGHNLVISGGSVLTFPGGVKAVPPTNAGVLQIDWNWDFRPDLIFAGAGGLKFYEQNAKTDGKFDDFTVKTKLPASILGAAYYGAWAFDFDLDGDLDVLIAPVSGAPVVLRNNTDGTFKPLNPFAGIFSVRDFVFADIDGDGDADAVFLDAKGLLHVFSNDRSGHFHARKSPEKLLQIVAITALDATDDGQMDIVGLQTDGVMVRITSRGEQSPWAVQEICRWDTPPAKMEVGSVRLFTQDLDNNGGIDLIASGISTSKIWLRNEQNKLTPLSTPISGKIFEVADINADGRLDFAGLTAQGEPILMTNHGVKNYHWQTLRMRANSKGKLDRDKRVNTFGVGGEVEVRAGLLVQKQRITGTLVHFGLGENLTRDVARIIWPNGKAQIEFELKGDQVVMTEQRLASSCPYLFAWNGKEMAFITDCIWRSPLGLKINAQDTAGVTETEDWLKIRGDQLAPREGLYDLRITAELWETHFFDHLALQIVDHPVGTEIFVDERFAFPAPALKIYTTGPLQQLASAHDDNGNDVSEILSSRDGKYLDNFGRGEYQGITRDHWVELELPKSSPKTGQVWLIANGWIHPTDSSINVAIGQGTHAPPQGLSLETQDTSGQWKTAKPGLGFPEGKVKNILINLEGVFKPGAPRKLRLRTNLEIFWDSIQWAAGQPSSATKVVRENPLSAELRNRGFSVIKAMDESSPELPISYIHLRGASQPWRDLAGYYTRFGDVEELVSGVDDRYVIMNAGDELALKFKEMPSPPTRMVRDYVMVGDGWVKDGNFNTTFSKTVLPLPAHDQHTYGVPPTSLENDPIYRRHAADWQTYHTRYIAPEIFRRGLRY